MREPTDFTLYFEGVARMRACASGAWGCILVDAAGLAVLEDTGVVRGGLSMTEASMELVGLTAGLRMASLLRLPIRTLTVQCRSRVLIGQMTDRLGVKDGLWRQGAEARRFARRIHCKTIKFVPLVATRSPATGLADRAFADARTRTPIRTLNPQTATRRIRSD